MINFQKFTLNNGLKVIVHEDQSTPLAVVNILYDVGARDEHPNKTGFAHLFEHLMFGGSINIPDYDRVLQKVGGENNAFTNNDITNYYLMLPANNLETAFWLESDRMLSLAFSPKSLSVQKKVVCEEFKERYLNQPYGDVWHLLRTLAYKKHPYKWTTIGKNVSHIKNTTLGDVKKFFKKYYHPSNAIMVVAGNVKLKQVNYLAKKWFESIPEGKKIHRSLPIEPLQKKARKLTVKRKVAANAIFKAYHMCSRVHVDYYATDLLSDVLSKGDSARLYVTLLKQKKLFSEIHAYISGSIDNGLFIIEGKLLPGIKMKKAENAIQDEIQKIKNKFIYADELTKCKNQIESSHVFSEVNVLHRAMNLAFAEHLGDSDLVNHEIEKYLSVTTTDINKIAKEVLHENNCSTLYYFSK